MSGIEHLPEPNIHWSNRQILQEHHQNGDSEHVFLSNHQVDGDQSPLPTHTHTDSLYASVLVHSAPTGPTQQGQGHFAGTECRTARLTLLPSGVVIINCCYSVLSTIPEVQQCTSLGQTDFTVNHNEWHNLIHIVFCMQAHMCYNLRNTIKYLILYIIAT